MSLNSEHERISQAVTGEFDCFELKELEEYYCSLLEHPAEGEAQRLPVDDDLCRAFKELHQMVQTIVVEACERPDMNQRFCRGSLRKQLL